ncbi:hypothetical protein [Sinomonas sp.]|jgi:hypothetical protein|uniref:hypothetical protein n=1 Tax=Sinomonas sp. TaxID=1914986 RepID=UPI002FDF7757
MKKISHTSWNLRKLHGVIVATGSHCPANGLWQPLDSDGEPLFVFEGSMMPTHAGATTEWMLVQTSNRILDHAQ